MKGIPMFVSRVRVLAAIIAASCATPALAQEGEASAPVAEGESSQVEEAVAFAKQLTADATTALTNDEKTEEEKLADFQVVLANGLALEAIGKFMLGDARKTMSDEQIARYDAVFPGYITKLYADQFQDIVGKPLEVIDAVPFGRDVIVRTRFDRKNDAPINVDWRVRKLKSGDHKAVDIIVSGVSIMMVKREEFSSFIATNGIDALLERLEQEAA